MSEEIKSIKKWFELAKPEPTEKAQMVQIGCHFEEFSEMLTSIGFIKSCDTVNAVDSIAEHFKAGKVSNFSGDIDKVELLDSLCDQIVTAIGVAHMLGFDIEGALNEVNNSNYSKFEDGKPVFNEQGKIAKGKDYFTPDLSEFV